MSRIGCMALAMLAAAACSRMPQDRGDAAVGEVAASGIMSGSTARVLAEHSFASLPDRGELVAYAPRDVRRDGAYTWHRANLSEAYALRSIAEGRLRLTTPSGEPLDVRYDSHVEHENGDWTWVGHADGHPEQQTILTFGPHAAFGTIAQADGLPLRLTVRNGASWVVETDARRIAGLHNAATDPTRPDFRIPPKTHGLSGSAAGRMSMAAAPAVASATAGTATTVDLVLGYTPAFASDNGGASGALTHLNFLVDVANTAYVNSGINAKVRLVHAMQVSYTDASSNEDTLEKLTGYDSTNSRQTTPDPAFNALRAARDQYGADLVSMVRSYRDPENDGCGIAWLIGGGQAGIATSDSYFGYSVVSDGTDQGTDGKTYYCLDETLAHELGHNMGAAHDVETSKGDNGVLDADEYGAYPYSFGYKTSASAGNFYTIMAYGDAGQQIYRIFSDPRSTFCGGRACGNASTADNARTLSQTIPTIASFRATAVGPDGHAVPNDFDGDGTSDILWRDISTGTNAIWKAASASNQKGIASVGNLDWSIAGTGDFDGDGIADVVWRNNSSGIGTIWKAGNSSTQQALTSVGNTDWRIVGIGDFNGDHKSDILWRNTASGSNTIWLSGSSASQQPVASVGNLAWGVAGVADFNGDGIDDIFWRDQGGGGNVIWLAGNASTKQWVSTLASADWAIAGFGDFNGDAKADVLWRNRRTGANTIWKTANAATQQAVTSVANVQWTVAAIGDYDGDGRSDVLWRNGSSGANTIWRGASGSAQQAVTTVWNLNWHVFG